MAAPNRKREVAAIVAKYPQALGEPMKTVDARRRLLMPIIVRGLNKIDAGQWALIYRMDREDDNPKPGRLTSDAIAWKPTKEHFDVLSATGPMWEAHGVITDPDWKLEHENNWPSWDDVADPGDPPPPPTGDDLESRVQRIEGWIKRPLWSIILILFVLTAPAAADTQLVARVVDGDTIVVESVGTVRLLGVDTPETVHPSKPVEAFGAEASAFLKALLLGHTVRLTYDRTRVDRYGRTLAYVYLSDGTLVNRTIIRKGYGFAYVRFPFRLRKSFVASERAARRACLGIWATAECPE